jgi:D-glycero-D-manno-heptose 1,7-bisphosphate phosphatase
LTQAGYRIVVATNQSGIARGLFSTRTLFDIHDAIQRAALQAGGRIDAFFFCPHAADAGCQCRKPQPGMLLEVARRFNIALKDTCMVGDARRDLQAAAAAGARPVLVLTGKGQKTQAEGSLPPGTQVFADLAAFAEHLAP